MFISTIYRHFVATVFALSLLSISGCGGGSSAGGSVTPTLPPDATKITTENVETLAKSAADSVAMVESFAELRPLQQAVPSAGDMVRVVTSKVFDRQHRSASVAMRTQERTVSEDCNGGGSMIINVDETATSVSGSVRFSNCAMIGEMVVDGSFTINSNWNESTGSYSDSGAGTLKMTAGSQGFTMVMNFSETGNEFDGSYATTLSFSISGTAGANFLVTTEEPIRGSFSTVSSGVLMVHGAAGTRLRIEFTSSGSANVYFDDGSGNFVLHSTIAV